MTVTQNIETPPISSGELSQLQTDVLPLMDQTCNIQRNTPTRGPTGNVIESYSTVHSGVVCSLGEPTPTMLQNYDYLIASEDAWTVRFPYGTDVLAKDHLAVGSQTLYVHVVLQPRSHQVFTRVLAAALK
jgi:hypothetical protein